MNENPNSNIIERIASGLVFFQTYFLKFYSIFVSSVDT